MAEAGGGLSRARGDAAEWGPGIAAPAPPEDESAARAAELAGLLQARRGERHLVAIQDFPDPDAISSGLAYREMARVFGIEADVVYDGQISHPENLALVNLLEIRLTRYQDGMELEAYDAAVFVDNQGTTTHLTERLRAAGVPTLAVIDHHDPQDVLDPVFADVRRVGAAATLVAEYLRSGRILRLDADNRSHVQLATALMHGLHSETDGFVHARAPEYRAAAYLSDFVDGDLLERVLCVQKSHATMDVIEAALANRVIQGGFSVAGVGYVRWADRDAIPQAADFLLAEENVHTAVVYGILCGDDGRELVSGSLRTAKVTLSVDAFLKEALGSDLRGRPYGGGRSRAGGFEIEVGFLAGAEDDHDGREAKWALFDRRIRRRIFRAAGMEDVVEDGCDTEG
ncbi:MAG TPA: bifunctional oligoribonuclease/PAP phosphatase NrnA [Longimicrobiaceae bacterium]|nr:bifunctional oligoribonuclease/PAP phosphatase NrnA [Longimicrobiaceae bacterium]